MESSEKTSNNLSTIHHSSSLKHVNSSTGNQRSITSLACSNQIGQEKMAATEKHLHVLQISLDDVCDIADGGFLTGKEYCKRSIGSRVLETTTYYIH
ncbi:hypothetical protein TNCV_2907731 [Trichonephila clavipes]|nr:hypothetical protein TNCV_2907731 [Trichonephila clavipes]